MTDETEKKPNAMNYYERKDIKCVTIDVAQRLIRNDILSTIKSWEEGHNTLKQSFRIVGPAGVGKTEMCQQIVNELSERTGDDYRLCMIKAPLFSRDDFIIPYPTITDEKKSFEMLYSDFIPDNPDDHILMVFDEESRADYPTQQVLMQLKNEGAIHQKKLPKHCWVISLDNPDDGEYMLNSMEDAAVLRRQLQLYVEANAKPFLDYARKSKFHKQVISYITTHPHKVYDYKSQQAGKLFANPASWERVSEALIKHELLTDEDGSPEQHGHDIDSMISGLLNTHAATLFLEFVKENKDIRPEDIFNNYAKERPRVQQMVKDKDNASLGNLMEAFVTHLSTALPKCTKKVQDNVANFLIDMPVDTAALFVSAIDGMDRKSEEFQYSWKLNNDLVKKNPKYKSDFFDKIQAAGQKSTKGTKG